MTKTKILIVEDEILIADTIQRYLEREGYEIIGIAISYEEAIQLFKRGQPDLALIDIRLNGIKTGLNFANFLAGQTQAIPFIYLTSQVDSRSISAAKKTMPAGYLSKPIQVGSLIASIEIALHNYRSTKLKEPVLRLSDGNTHHKVPIKDISCLMSEHIYVRIYTNSNSSYLYRGALKDMMESLPCPPFVQVHRSYAVNLGKITGWDLQQLFIQDLQIPVSRSRRREVFSYLEKGI